MHRIYKLIFPVILYTAFIIFFTFPIFASTDPQISDSPVTANIPLATPTPSGAPPSADTTPPTIPILIRPSDGTVSPDNTPQFAWYQSTDPNSNFVAYTVYLNGTATYLGVSNIGNSAGNGYVAFLDSNQVVLTPTSGFPDGVFSWRVVAYDAAGNESSSALWHFTVDTVPPVITITDIDTLHNPVITEGTIFDITGPKEIGIQLTSEPYTAIRIVIFDDAGVQEYSITGTTDGNGILTVAQYLPLGTHKIQVSATDRAGLTAVLPDFFLHLKRSEIVIPVPGVTPPPTIPVPPFISNLPHALTEFPATISNIAARGDIAVLLVGLLAIAILILLFLLWNRRNLELIDDRGNPVATAQVWHSHPSFAFTPSQPIKLIPAHQGKLFIPHLSRFSTLTIKHTHATVTVCLIRDAKKYTIIV